MDDPVLGRQSTKRPRGHEPVERQRPTPSVMLDVRFGYRHHASTLEMVTELMEQSDQRRFRQEDFAVDVIVRRTSSDLQTRGVDPINATDRVQPRRHISDFLVAGLG